MIGRFLRELLPRKPHSAPRRQIAARPRCTTMRPSLELLESRLVPSGFAVSAGGLGADAGLAVATDRAGDVYVAGYISASGATFDAITHGIHLTSSGGQDGFVAKFAKTTGQCLWAESLGGQYDDKATALAVDARGDVYVTGYINSTASLPPGTVPPATSPISIGGQVVLPNAATVVGGNAYVAVPS